MKKSIALVIMLLSFKCFSQEAAVSKDQTNVAKTVIEEPELTDDQIRFFLKNTTKDRDGVHRIKSDERYPQLIRIFKKHPDLEEKIPESFVHLSTELAAFGYKFFGKIQEDKFRITLIYTNEVGTDLMLTRWNYRESGATISVAKNMINVKVGDEPAVLSFTSAGHGDGMWKCTWWKDGVSYEVYVGDSANSRDDPLLSREKVIGIASTFLESSATLRKPEH